MNPSNALAELPVRAAVAPARSVEPIMRPAMPEDTPAILSLIAASYERPDDPAWHAYWQWKHERNPFGLSPCVVAEADGRLVGVRVFMRWAWRCGTSEIRAVRAVDTATHPEWQGRGIFSRLTTHLVEEMRREGVGFIFNTPNGKSMPGYLKMGWTEVTRIPLWVRPLRAEAAVRQLLRLDSRLSSPVFGRFEPAAGVLQDPRLPALLDEIGVGDERYHTARTLEYLRWRYAEIPGHTYGARFEATRDARALIVARSRLRGHLRELTISELLVTPSSYGVQLGRALIRDLIHEIQADYVAACAARGTAERRVLARSGFLPVPRLGPHFTARPLNAVGPDPSNWASWRCSIGDLELF
jgi:GNAT superfamily N-acetyltransferase